jgi:hypothetical protein
MNTNAEIHRAPTAPPFEYDMAAVARARLNARPFREVTPNGNLRLNFHQGQARAWASMARIVAVIAGAQSGKTVFGAHWLLREIAARGNEKGVGGDYMVVTPTFSLLELKALKEFRYVFETLYNLGRYYSSPVRRFVFSEEGMVWVHGLDAKGNPNFDPDYPTTVYFGYADNPESLESATVKGIWADEAGQRRFRLGSFEALRRRAAIHRARILITTTPYDIGWLKTEVHDRWLRGERDSTGRLYAEVINFPSILNPLFSIEEFEEARATLPAWKFAMFYLGQFVKPAGLIYDWFENEPPFVIPSFDPPQHWPRTLGVDFGAPNIAGVFLATEFPKKIHHVYREYRPRKTRAASDHTRRLLRGENYEVKRDAGLFVGVGGSRSETQWRVQFDEAGLDLIASPIFEVEVGIDTVYGAGKTGRLVVHDNCPNLIDELLSYSRVLDQYGNPTAKIENKSAYHLADALRYGVAEAENPDREWPHDKSSEAFARALNPDLNLGRNSKRGDDELRDDEDEFSRIQRIGRRPQTR